MSSCSTNPNSCDRRSRIAALGPVFLIAPLLAAGQGHRPPAARTPPTWPAVSEVDISRACAGTRWIGVLDEEQIRIPPNEEPGDELPRSEASSKVSPCPEGWDPLFASAHTRLPPGLRRFCVYESGGAGDPREDLRRIEEGRVVYGTGEKAGPEGFFESIHRDCRVVGPAAESFFSRYFWPLRERFVREAGGAEEPVASDRVRLVIVDSVRDGADEPEQDECGYRSRGEYECSPHGRALAGLAKDLLCDADQKNCEAEVGSRRVLRWTYEIQAVSPAPVERELEIGEPGGGFYGSWSDLAKAIEREVAEWSAIPQPARPRLILNLSVGWEEIYGKNVPEVRDAIEVAVCRGALVVAAAGNRRAGPRSMEKPLLPAAWEQDPAPSLARCVELLGEPPPASFDSPTPYRPLLYAVGGVRHDGRLLSNMRPRSTPRFVAFGDHAPAMYPTSPPRKERPADPLPPEPQPLVTLTGTSVSTVVVSAAAAVRWNDDLGLSAFQVMDALWESGSAVEQPIDFCLDPQTNCSGARHARRVFVHPLTLAAASSWPPIDSGKQAFDKLVEQREFSGFAHVLDCDPDVLFYAEGGLAPNANLCPQRWQVDVGARPWLGPQPGPNHNPTCTYSSGSPGLLVLEFDPCFRVQGMPVWIDDLTLVAGDKAYRLPGRFKLGDPDQPCPSKPDEKARQRHQIVLSDPSFAEVYPMYLAVTVNGEYGAITPILHARHEND